MTTPTTIYQTGHDIEPGQEAKYVVGRILRFLGYAPEAGMEGDVLTEGELVVVRGENNGMGIYVRAVEKEGHDLDSVGLFEMVFPEEVEVIE